jgi:very-short-patch-repair endonuclease
MARTPKEKPRDPLFDAVLAAEGLPLPEPEYRFAPPRRWRFDWAWVDHKIALEQEGGVWTRGRHTRGAGFIGDMAKYNHAALLGWRVLRIESNQLYHGATVELIKAALNGKTLP